MKHPYAEVQLRKDGTVHDPAELSAAVDMVKSSGATDALLLVHGWNNDMGAARRLYANLDTSLKAVEPAGAAGRTLAIIGILWPSVKWADDDSVAGGGAGLEDPAAALVLEISERVEDPTIQARLVELVPELDTSPAARAEYLDLLRGLIPEAADGDEEPPPSTLVEGDAETVFDAAGGSSGLTGAPATGGAAGISVGGFLKAARTLLNTTTYYTMKDRAGKAGAVGVNQVLQAVAAAAPDADLHLAGHSFGARAVTAAAHATPAQLSSVSLLQAAFSHYALATDYDGKGHNGAFWGTPGKLSGPMIITHTRNDRAVGLAYAIASRLARQTAAGVGDAGDPYGGMGSNGAQKTPEAGVDQELLDVGAAYHFAPGTVANLQADRFIDNHGDVSNEQVAHAVYSAILA